MVNKSIKNFSKDELLEIAIRSRRNSILLKDAAKELEKKKPHRTFGLFHQYTSAEELEKALFCMFAHRGIMKPEQLVPVFNNHATKIILFHMIFRNKKFKLINYKFYYGNVLLQDLDLNEIVESNKKYYEKYMKERNACIYVEPNSDRTTHEPSRSNINVKQKMEELNVQKTWINAIFDLVWANDLVGNLDDFDYYKLTPKNKPPKYNFTFSGSGEVIPRKDSDYRPKRVLDRIEK